MRVPSRFPWGEWIECLNGSALPERLKAIGRQIPPRAKRSKRALAPWEFDATYDDFHNIATLGLLYLIPGCGHFSAIYDPLPAKGSIVISRSAALIIHKMLRGEWKLYRISKAGYINQPTDTRKWVWHESNASSVRSLAKEGEAESLLTAGLIEPDGCGHGWPFQWDSSFCVNKRRLVGVRSLQKIGIEYVRERIKSAG